MNTAIAYIITVLGVQVGLITICTFIVNLPLLPIIKKINSKAVWFAFDFIVETIGGIATIWLTILTWKWFKVTPSILVPILLAIPVIIWNWTRIKPQIGTKAQWDEVVMALGTLTGLIIGSVILL